MPAPMQLVSRSGNYVTIRTTRSATFGTRIPFGGRVSGTFPPGTVFTGRDNNGNNVPDILERPLRTGEIRFTSGN
jgi:hypothetical protein